MITGKPASLLLATDVDWVPTVKLGSLLFHEEQSNNNGIEKREYRFTNTIYSTNDSASIILKK